MRSSDNLHTGIKDDQKWKARWREDHWKSPASASFSGGERNHFFLNLKGKQFDDIAGLVGLDSSSDSRAWSSIDVDHDGLVDIAMVNSNNPVFALYHNDASEVFSHDVIGSMVAIDLRGGHKGAEASHEWSNRDAIGSRVRVHLVDGTVLLREKRMGEGFASQNSATMLVGVGEASRVAKIEVTWPSGKQSVVSDVGVGQRVGIFEDPADSPDGTGVTLRPYFDRHVATVGEGGLDSARRFTVEAVPARPAAELRMYTTMATWCESCKKHLPQFGVLQEALGEKVALFGLPMDDQDTVEMLRGYVEENTPGYELLAELSAADREVARTLLAEVVRKDVLPSTIVTDAEGRVLLAMAGLPSVSELRALLMR